MTTRKALRDLFARKLRTFLVVVSIAVGVFGVSAIRIASEQVERGATEQYGRSNPPDITIPTSALSDDARQQIADIANVERVEGRQAGQARWKPPERGDREHLIDLHSLPANRDGALDVPALAAGLDQQQPSEWPKEGEILFELGSRRFFNLKPGDTVTLLDADKTEHQFKVAGFAEKSGVLSGQPTGRAAAWLNREDSRRVLKSDDDTRVLVKLRDASTEQLRQDTNDLVRKRLEDAEAKLGDSTIRDPNAFEGQDLFEVLRTVSVAFALVGAFASGLLVINTISTIVLEQRGQIGSMKAVGASTGQIMRLYVFLALLYGLLGTILGLAAAIGFNVLGAFARGVALDKQPTLPSVSGEALAQAVGIGLGVAVLAALLPAWRGARTTIREAMASYGLGSDFGNSPWDRLMAALGFLPQSAKLASRNVFRQTNRALLTIVGLAVATAATLAVLAALIALGNSFDAATRVLKADLAVSFQAPVQTSTIDDALADTNGIDHRELWVSGAAKIKDTNTTVPIKGLPADSDIFDRATVREGGQWLGADAEDEAVITRRLAERRGLNVGDTLELEQGDRTATLKVVGIVGGAGGDAQVPDGVVYAPVAAVRKLLGLPEGFRNLMYVRLSDGPAKAGIAPGEVLAPPNAERKQAVDERADALADALADANLTTSPTKLYEESQANQRSLVPIGLLFGLVLVVVAAVGALGLFSTLTMNVLERRKEIGVMRSIGAPTGTLLWTYLLEGLLLGLIGWGIGSALGGPAGERLVVILNERLIPVEYSLPREVVIATLVLVVLVAFFSSIGPALAAARMRIAEILRYS